MAAGDGDAAAAFVRRFRPRVHGLALAIVGSTTVAEDVTQEAFLRVWLNAVTYDPRRGHVATWVLTITRNLAVDVVRADSEQPIDPEVLMGVLVSREEGLAQPVPFEAWEPLRQALRALPPEQSRLVVLSVAYGLTAQETADLEGIPLGTAKTRIRRGLAKLRLALA
jgi:RNA polymerase sigma-70 factor (ECF subfamily)